MRAFVYLPREAVERILNTYSEAEPNGWKRIAAKQYNIAYSNVTDEQARMMKHLYWSVLYSPGPQKIGELYVGPIRSSSGAV